MVALLCLSTANAEVKKEAPTGTAEARRLGDAFTTVVTKLGPSVVQIDVTNRDEHATMMGMIQGRPGEVFSRGMGSGVIISSDGAILTNNHVIEQALAINVRISDGRILAAKLVARDPATDLAVLKVDAKDLPAAKFADSEAARVGDWVVAIGSPFGLGKTVTTGVVSAKGRGSLGVSTVEDYLQTDASINPGNSGGPLANLDGEVLGINTMIVGRGSGIGFAVPANMARRVANQLLSKGKVERAFVGIGVQDVTPALAEEMKVVAGMGALVNTVVAGSPGAKGNLKPGDVVLTVSGRPIRGAQDFIREVLSLDVGSNVPLEVLRGGQKYGSQVQLAARVEPQVPPIPAQLTATSDRLGLGIRDLTSEQAAAAGHPATAACQIVQVVVGSAADRAGVRVGDLIVEADGTLDPSADAVQKALSDGHALVRVRRRDGMFYTVIRR